MSKVTFQVSTDGLEPDLEAWFDDIMAEAVLRIKERTPVRSGALQDSIQAPKTLDGYEIGSDVEYFPYVEFGTSKMEPRAMVRTTLEELPTIADRTSVKWKK